MDGNRDACPGCGARLSDIGFGAGCSCPPASRERDPDPDRPFPAYTSTKVQDRYVSELLRLRGARTSLAWEVELARADVARLEKGLGIARAALSARAGRLTAWDEDDSEGRVYVCAVCLRRYPTGGDTAEHRKCVCGGTCSRRCLPA